MGRITTKGTASRWVDYDGMTVTIEFEAREKRTKESLRKVMEESEGFLKELSSEGIDISLIEAGRSQVTKGRYSDEEYVEAKRAISMRTVYNLHLTDVVMKMVEQNAYEANINIKPEILDKEIVHKELMQEAVKDARKKADMMAEAAGTTVIGIKRIGEKSNEPYMLRDSRTQYLEVPQFLRSTASDPSLFSQLKTETSLEEESIYIEWILED